MLSDWKYILTHDWNFMRVFRLGLAIVILTEAWMSSELLFAGLGVVLLFQSLLNVGCCGSGGCGINTARGRSGPETSVTNDVSFEEIKIKEK